MTYDLHAVGLDLGSHDQERPVITIDGFEVRNVTNVQVDAPANGVTQVTVSFLAKSITGTRSAAAPDPIPKPVTNGG